MVGAAVMGGTGAAAVDSIAVLTAAEATAAVALSCLSLQPGKSSSLSPGRKVSTFSQVTDHSGVGRPPLSKNSPDCESITSSMFLSDSGRASDRMSVAAVWQNWPSRSSMVSHRAAKVGREARGPRCCRNTLESIMEALSLVSSRPCSRPSSSLRSMGKRTRRKANSHWWGASTERSGTSRARWGEVEVGGAGGRRPYLEQRESLSPDSGPGVTAKPGHTLEHGTPGRVPQVGGGALPGLVDLGEGHTPVSVLTSRARE